MLLHNLKYEFLRNIREKELIGWMMIFPIILGTFFNLAFGSLYEQEEMFSEIPVAVVENSADEAFTAVLNGLSEGEACLFAPQYTDKENAQEILKEGKISGIIYVDEEITMTVISDGISQSIVRSFIEQYSSRKAIITETAMNNPEKLEAVIAQLSKEIDCMNTKSLSGGNMDPYVSYFQNLIAMVALFATTNGVLAATQNQGNLSPIGARKCVSPVHKLKGTIASLLAAFLAQVMCTFISITYIVFVLGINMGDKILLIYLSGAAGSLAGTSLGFFIGSIGRMSEAAKIGIAFTVTMACCFLSGLMISGIKPLFAQYCPIINKINPAALISDLFYCLAIYDDYSRFTEIIVTLLSMSVIFTAGGFLLTRRKKYASI